MRALILYYSRTGYNAKLCQELKASLSCDIEQIIDKTDRSGIWNYIKAGYQSWSKKTTEIEPIKGNFDYYDLIILGTPLWASANLPPATRTFLRQYRDKIKRLAFISVSGLGQRNKRCLKDLKSESGQEVELHLLLSEAEIKSKTYTERLEAFVRNIKVLKNVKGDLLAP